MNSLELFCGTKCVSNVLDKKGYNTTTLDFNEKFNPTFCEDILEWDYKQFQPSHFKLIWASPDCTSWSIASGGIHRKKDNINGHSETATLGNRMITRTMEIIDYFKPQFWFIENPRGLLTHYPPFKAWRTLQGGNQVCVFYGNYGWTFPKPTHIWSNVPLWDNEKKPVMSEDCFVVSKDYWMCSQTGTQDRVRRFYKDYRNGSSASRSMIPTPLIEKLIGLTE